MNEYEYEAQADVVPLFMMVPGPAQVIRVGIRSLDAADWVGDVLDGGAQLPDAAKVTLRDADTKGTSREGWSARATFTKAANGTTALLNGEGAFRPPPT